MSDAERISAVSPSFVPIPSMLTWTATDAFELGGSEYVCRPIRGRFPSEPGRFCLVKPRWQVEAYEALLRELSPQAIVEVGMWDGASAAFFAEIARPKKLVTIDRRPAPSAALIDFMAREEFASTMAAYCGVDQGDAARLSEILSAEFGDEPLDLVVDDASHLVGLTRQTFNCLFPHLRPGGTYLIEDWSWAHNALGACGEWGDEVPLTVLVFELILACAHRPTLISNVNVYQNWALVTRGDAEIAPGSFDLSRCYGPRGRALIPDL